MDRAKLVDDSEGWIQVTIGPLRDLPDASPLEGMVRWCKLHASDGKWDCGIQWTHAIFRFEQLEDAMMFRLIWCKGSG